MNLAILIDMNLPPAWVAFLQNAGYSARHWSSVGDPRASDLAIMEWARSNHHMVFTHDLDFGTMLALTHGTGPSVLQVRCEDVTPERIGDVVLLAIKQHEKDLESGALVVVDEGRNRVRILPI